MSCSTCFTNLYNNSSETLCAPIFSGYYVISNATMGLQKWEVLNST
jgi:hypothetical protein